MVKIGLYIYISYIKKYVEHCYEVFILNISTITQAAHPHLIDHFWF